MLHPPIMYQLEKVPFMYFLLIILKPNFPTYDWFCADGSHMTCAVDTSEILWYLWIACIRAIVGTGNVVIMFHKCSWFWQWCYDVFWLAEDTKSSVLKKAVSFRNDLKSRIARKSSSAFGTENAAVARSTMPKKKLPTHLPRTGSFTDGPKETAVTAKKSVSAREIQISSVFQSWAVALI